MMKWLVMACLFSTLTFLVSACVNYKSEYEASVEPVYKRNPAVIDRMGRAEITNFIIRDPSKKKEYNGADTFALSVSQAESYRLLFLRGLIFWDDLDQKRDWQVLDDQANITEMWVNDYLVVDTSKVCSVNDLTYLEIERTPHGANKTCGGRTPNDDVIDTMMSLLIAGPDADNQAYTDGVDGVPRPAHDTFPYLAAPYETPN